MFDMSKNSLKTDIIWIDKFDIIAPSLILNENTVILKKRPEKLISINTIKWRYLFETPDGKVFAVVEFMNLNH